MLSFLRDGGRIAFDTFGAGFKIFKNSVSHLRHTHLMDE